MLPGKYGTCHSSATLGAKHQPTLPTDADVTEGPSRARGRCLPTTRRVYHDKILRAFQATALGMSLRAWGSGPGSTRPKVKSGGCRSCQGQSHNIPGSLVQYLRGRGSPTQQPGRTQSPLPDEVISEMPC